MSTGSWARHYQEVWQSRAGDPRLPHWLRVAAAAYGSHSDNGHARYKRGELALILGTVDGATGEIKPYRNLGRAIDDAVAYGWLDGDSFWGCLIVPAHAIKRGGLGVNPSCPIHVKRARRGHQSLTERGIGDFESTLSEGFTPRTTHSVSDSTLNPLSSVLPLPRQRQHHRRTG